MVLILVGQPPGCLSKSLSLSVSNCIDCGTLKDYFSCPAYTYTFLGGKKSTKRTGPGRTKRLREAALQWTGPATDTPAGCIKDIAFPATAWF